jgi:hypothetical protein
MALAITQTGKEISTEKLLITAVTDAPDPPNQVTSVIMEVFINNDTLLHELEHLPDFGTDNEFSFEINSIVKDYFASEFLPLSGVSQTVTENAIVFLKFYQVSPIFGKDLTSYDYTVVVKNMTQDTFEIEEFDLADYDCGDSGSSSSKLLTTAPNPVYVANNTSFFVSCLTTSYTGTTPKQEWVIERYLNGVLSLATTEDVDVPTRDILPDVPAGKYDISNYRYDFDSSGADEVRIYIRDKASPFTVRSETRSFKLQGLCEKATTLTWLNEFGVWDSYTLAGNITRVGKYKDDTFKKVRPVDPVSTDVGDLVYNSSYNYQYDLFGDRMPETTVQWLSKMLINKRAAIQTEASSESEGLAITSDDYYGSMPEAASYFGMVDGGNGFAYGAPARSGNFLKYDLTNDTLSTIASPYPAGAGIYYTYGIRSNVNGKIYYMNDISTSSDILVFDPTLETFTNIGVLTTSYGVPTITPSGVIYAGGDAGTTKVLKIDTNTDTVSELTIGTYAVNTATYVSGFVYLITNQGEFYKLDVSDDTFTTVLSADLSLAIERSSLTSTGKIYTLKYQAPNTNDIVVLDTNTDTTYTFSTGSVINQGYGSTFVMSDDNVYLLGLNEADVLKIDTTDDSISVATTITSGNFDLPVVIGNKVYGISGDLGGSVIKLTFEESVIVTAGKFFPIVIETDESTLEDKFAPSTLFRVKFRLANRRKGLK